MTRPALYAKQIRDGQSELELSPEEAEAVRIAATSRAAAMTRQPLQTDRAGGGRCSPRSPIWARRAPSARRRCSAACAAGAAEPVPFATTREAVLAVQPRRGDLGAGADRELAGGRGHRHAGHADRTRP